MNEVQILLVEDNADDVDLALLALRRSHLANEIVVVNDGESAIDFLFCQGKHAERHPHLHSFIIFLDMKLPRMDGMEVLRRVRSDPRTQSFPVVIMISSPIQKEKIEAEQLNHSAFIQKPIDFKQFQEVVTQLGFYWMVTNPPSRKPKAATTRLSA